MGVQAGPNIVRNSSLILELDAADRNSYVSGSNTWVDLNNNTTNLTLAVTGSGAASASFNTSNQGTLTFTGSASAHSYAVNTTPNILTSSINLSICVWLYPRTPPQVITGIIDFNHAGGNNGWVIQSEDSTTNRYYYFSYYRSGSAGQYEPVGGFGAGKGMQLTYNTWQHVCYTKSGTSVTGYINGVQKINYTATNANIGYTSSIQPLYISAVAGNARFTNGDYGIVQIYNIGLSASEVLQNYNAQKSRFGL